MLSSTRYRLVFLLLAPQCIVGAILLFSPNFDSGGKNNETLGSDFLQEYTGAHIMGSSQAERLYDPVHSRQVQHTVELVGFEFPDSDYYPMIYPPFYYLVLVPISWIPYPLAMKFWLVGLGLCVSANIWIVTQYFPPLSKHWGAWTLVTMLFTPTFVSLTMAHKSVILLLILNTTYLLLFWGRPVAAGCVFGLIAFKPHLALLIGFAFLLKRQWQFVKGACLTVSGLIALCFIRGPKPCIDYFMQCIGMLNYVQTGGYQLQQAHGITGAVEFMTGAWGAHVATVMTATFATLAILLLIFVLNEDHETSSPEFGIQYSALVVATVLLSPHFYFYDLTILLVPIMILGAIGLGAWKINSVVSAPRQTFVLIVVTLFVGSCCFTKIASATGIQLSLPLLLGTLAFLSRSGSEVSRSAAIATPA